MPRVLGVLTSLTGLAPLTSLASFGDGSRFHCHRVITAACRLVLVLQAKTSGLDVFVQGVSNLWWVRSNAALVSSCFCYVSKIWKVSSIGLKEIVRSKSGTFSIKSLKKVPSHSWRSASCHVEMNLSKFWRIGNIRLTAKAEREPSVLLTIFPPMTWVDAWGAWPTLLSEYLSDFSRVLIELHINLKIV